MSTRSEVSFRRAETEDAEFLYRVYALTRQEELALTGWTSEQIEAFLRMQFRAQDTHYRTYHPASTFDLILLDGEPAGRIYLERQPHEILLLDIALLPEQRGRGVGTRIMHDLLAEAAGANQCVRLHVEAYNPAKRLYLRLGFVKSGESGPYEEMRWTGGPKAPSKTGG